MQLQPASKPVSQSPFDVGEGGSRGEGWAERSCFGLSTVTADIARASEILLSAALYTATPGPLLLRPTFAISKGLPAHLRAGRSWERRQKDGRVMYEGIRSSGAVSQSYGECSEAANPTERWRIKDVKAGSLQTLHLFQCVKYREMGCVNRHGAAAFKTRLWRKYEAARN